VWAADNGKHLLALGPLSAKPKALAWSGDGTRIAVVATATDTKVRIFDSSDGTQLTQIEMPSGGSWSGVALSHDGKMIAVASGARVLLYGLDPQRLFVELKLGGTGDARCVNFSPDGEYLIVAAGSMTSVWNWKSGKLVGKVNPKLWTKRTAKSSSYFNLEVRSLAVSPDSRLMAMGLVTGEIQIRTLPSLGEVAVLKPSGGWVEAMDFSADGRTLASGSWNRTVHLWDLASGLECAALEDLPHPAFALKFSADTSKLVAVGRYGLLKTWDASR
jgi:WD40 repeat protein